MPFILTFDFHRVAPIFARIMNWLVKWADEALLPLRKGVRGHAASEDDMEKVASVSSEVKYKISNYFFQIIHIT